MQIANAAVEFSALLLRVRDMMLMTFERAASTFKEEVASQLFDLMQGKADVEANVPIAPELTQSPQADLVIRAKGHDPVAVFLVMSDKHLLESMLTATEAAYRFHIPCSVVSLIESEASVSQKTLKQAMPRVSPMYYRGHEKASLSGILKEALGVVPDYTH